MGRIKIQDINLDVLTVQETVSFVKQYILEQKPLHLMGVNADKINQCKQNSQLKNIVNSCDIINADGASVILASKFLKRPLPERVAGIDLMMELVELASENDFPVYLLGAKQEVVSKTKDVLLTKFPNLDIVGIRSGYFDDNQWLDVFNSIEKEKPAIVFVGITSPKKEYLIDYFQREGSISVYMGVGGSFDVISGNIKRAPIWMQKLNIEWFYRMCQEPRRLFKRYMVGNISFIFHICLEKFK